MGNEDSEQNTEPDARGAFDSMDIDVSNRMIYAVVAIFTFVTFAVRSRMYQRFIDGDTVLFTGQSSTYQYRSVLYTVKNWPRPIATDVMIGYPTGVDVGMYGTLYDQLLATVALIVGLGNPTNQTVGWVVLFAGPVFVSLSVIVAFFAGRTISDWKTGLTASALVMVYPGLFALTTSVGFSTSIVTSSVMGGLFLYTGFNGIKEMEMYTQGDFFIPELAQVKYTLLSGVTLGVSVLLWPPSIVFAIPLFLYFAIDSSVSYFLGLTVHQQSAFTGIVSSVAAAITLLGVPQVTPSMWTLSLGHTFFLLVLAFYAVILSTLTSEIEFESRTITTYAVLALSLFTAAVLSFISTPLFEMLSVMFTFVFGFTTPLPFFQQPLATSSQQLANALFTNFGLTPILALIGLVVAVKRSLLEGGSPYVFIVLLTLTAFFTAVSQYQLVVLFAPILAVVAAFGLAATYKRLMVTDVSFSYNNWPLKNYLILICLIAVVVPVLVLPANANIVSTTSQNSPTNFAAWEQPMEWIENNTENPGVTLGTSGGPNYQYPDEAYGILTWGSASNYLPIEANRISVTDSFGETNELAARILLSPTERNARSIMESNNAEVRYIAIHNSMVRPTGSLPSIVQSHPGLTQSDMYFPLYDRQSGRQVAAIRQDPYYRSLMVRMFYYHGSAKRPQSIVIDWDKRRVGSGQSVAVTRPNQTIRQFQGIRRAQRFVQQDRTAQVGGYRQATTTTVPALKHYRYVYSSPQPSETLGPGSSRVKIFERVEGATINGTAPNGATVRASLVLETGTGKQFQYVQTAQANETGHFTMTLPYSTTGYNNTDKRINVRAVRENYTFSALTIVGNGTLASFTGQLSVSEQDVQNGNTLNVELERQRPNQNQTTGNQTMGNETTNNETPAGNRTAGNTSGNGTNGTQTPTPEPTPTPTPTPEAPPTQTSSPESDEQNTTSTP